jgi:hypothetical protein
MVAIVWILLLSTLAFGQRIDEQTRQEIQRVKEYMAARMVRGGRPQTSPGEVPWETKGFVRTMPALRKTAGQADRKSFFMNGNKIATEVYNYGGIAPGYGLIRGVNNVVWNHLDYVFQFCPIVGASVPDPRYPDRQIRIISDGLNDYPNYREVNPTGDTLWQWQPLPGYADPDQSHMASNPAPDDDRDGKPDSWPRTWYNPLTGKYVWPGYLSQDVTSADLEVFWAMDDRENTEFPYYPFVNDSTRKGIGVQVDGRAFQWSNALAEDAIFFVYTITNVSDKDLDTVLFGIYGDPDLGGGCNESCGENGDDNGFFIPPYDTTGEVEKIPVYSRSMVYFWDPDMKGARGLPLGYVACKFLESPGNPEDGIDNDGDGIVDERQDDGIDNDGDWNPINDDVGIDGVPNTQDPGEGDGVPTAGIRLPDGTLDPLHPGEPNFELTDLDEADQIGLTSFNSWTWSTDKISNDSSMWARCTPRNFGDIAQNQDIVFIFGSGYISLKKGETKRISMALLMGESLDDLLTSAKTVQTIYNQNYRFFKPPLTPKVTAVPDDKKVTLYWDTRPEQSIDPITGEDFEGYVIYRSTDPSFGDVQSITDGKGSKFLSEPLKDIQGNEAKWDVAFRDEPFTDANGNGRYDAGEDYIDVNRDSRWTAQIPDWWKGYHPVAYQDRGIHYYLGNNRGLVHTYVDSNNVINGQTYYYAVVAYDHGDSVGIPPTETTKKITVDPITSKLVFDVNTVQVIPGPRASGYLPPSVGAQDAVHEQGIGTGRVEFSVVNDLDVVDGGEYSLTFADSLLYGVTWVKAKNYSILNMKPVTEHFTPFDTNFTSLSHENLADDPVLQVRGKDGTAYTRDADYVVNLQRGSIRRTGNSTMPSDQEFLITYRYYPVYQSEALKGEDSNPVFDGIETRVIDEQILEYDSTRSRWVEGKTNFTFLVRPANVGPRRMLWPADYEISFSANTIDTAVIPFGGLTRIPVKYSVKDVTTGVPRPILTILYENNRTRDMQWSPGEEIVLFQPGAHGVPTDTTTWSVIVSAPADTATAAVLPTDGDILLVKTKRPFSPEDAYSLTTTSGKLDPQVASSRLDMIYVVPNPYVGLNEIEPANPLPGQTRGERRIYFENLPPQCTIRVFTLSGDLVQTIQHDTGWDNGREYWNLLNRDGFSIAYGVYVAHIDAPGIGEKITKFAIIK